LKYPDFEEIHCIVYFQLFYCHLHVAAMASEKAAATAVLVKDLGFTLLSAGTDPGAE
jgi:hypothetical protein